MLPTSFCPTKSHQEQTTLILPRLNYQIDLKHLSPLTATEKGHMVRTRQGVRSTHSNRKEILDARLLVDDMNPPEQACTVVDSEMFCFAVLAAKIEGTIYSDQMGHFSTRSFGGNNYIFAAYIYEPNAILLVT